MMKLPMFTEDISYNLYEYIINKSNIIFQAQLFVKLLVILL